MFFWDVFVKKHAYGAPVIPQIEESRTNFGDTGRPNLGVRHILVPLAPPKSYQKDTTDGSVIRHSQLELYELNF